MGWWMTLEKLLNIEVPKRAQYLRNLIMLRNYFAICSTYLLIPNLVRYAGFTLGAKYEKAGTSFAAAAVAF
jgi:NADH:ubiquinone oxidoreductase subunit D